MSDAKVSKSHTKKSCTKTQWEGYPTRTVVKVIEVMNQRNGRTSHVALLDCGHGVFKAKSSLANTTASVKRCACYACPPIEKADEPLQLRLITTFKRNQKAPEPTDAVAELTASIKELANMLQVERSTVKALEDRLTQLEDVKTTPHP